MLPTHQVQCVHLLLLDVPFPRRQDLAARRRALREILPAHIGAGQLRVVRPWCRGCSRPGRPWCRGSSSCPIGCRPNLDLRR